MTFDQAAILALMAALLAAFALDRFRIEVVAIAGLAVGLLLGIVPFDRAFDGLSNPAVVTVAEILIIAHLIARSHLVDALTAWMSRRVAGEHRVVMLVCALGAATSVFVNNVGALALLLPLALSIARTAGLPAGRLLMPLSFATLLGGTCSLIGTPANLVASTFRTGAVGAPFAFFDMAWVGVPVALAGLAWLAAAGPRLLATAGGAAAARGAPGGRRFVTEFRVPPGSSWIGLSAVEAEQRLAGTIHAHLRNGQHVFGRREAQRLEDGDLLLVQADLSVVTGLEQARDALLERRQPGQDRAWVEAVVMPQSTIIGSTLRTLEHFDEIGIEIVALAPQTPRIEGRLADVAIGVGDILLLRGQREAIDEMLGETDCLALSPRGIEPTEPQGWKAAALFAVAVGIAATGAVQPQIAFGGAILALMLLGALDLRRAVAELNWPILIMLAAMIPLGEAVASTGAADMLAGSLMEAAGQAPPIVLVGLVLLAAIAITPFVNNVSTVIAVAPVATAIAQRAGLPPDPFLIAVALGASFDFLTPFGHHNNTIVMGIAGYRFSDFPKLGLPLLVIACAVALVAIRLVWMP